MLLAERDPRSRALAHDARRLLASVDADDGVRRWIIDRLQPLL
jgi:hypothetical protein